MLMGSANENDNFVKYNLFKARNKIMGIYKH